MTDRRSVKLVHTSLVKESNVTMYNYVVAMCERFLCGDDFNEFPDRELNLNIEAGIMSEKWFMHKLTDNIKDRCPKLRSGGDFIENEVSIPDGKNGFETVKLRLTLGQRVWKMYDTSMVIYWSCAMSSIHMTEIITSIERQVNAGRFKIWLFVYSLVLHGLKDLQEKIEKKGLVIEEIKL